MRTALLFCCMVLAGVLAASAPVGAATRTTFTALDVPGADSTEVHGVIRVGVLLQYVEVVGFFHDPHGTHGFVWSRGRFTTLNYPGAANTWTMGLNRTGQIVGYYAGADGVVRGFVSTAGNYTTITCPLNVGRGPANVAPNAINDAGTIVGDFGPAGFAFTAGECVFPIRQDAIYINAINNNGLAAATIVNENNAIHGQTLMPLATNDNPLQIDVPGALATWATGVNDTSQVVGYYQTGTRLISTVRGFILSNSVFATLQYPGAFSTEPFAIDTPTAPTGAYDIVGFYGGRSGAHHGFIATLSPQVVSLP
ncbi:MAG: hypothetical protein ABSB70_12425 [Candidatus Velthaea sp.]